MEGNGWMELDLPLEVALQGYWDQAGKKGTNVNKSAF